ncbi:MAG: 1-acyl-sn-glycerol-3-phosphate acyltransferase [Rhodothermales bacterium]|nr:1-acyl-sn-glycerol-3-phosphate acyltransferase [Rhodothermales bacterium]
MPKRSVLAPLNSPGATEEVPTFPESPDAAPAPMRAARVARVGAAMTVAVVRATAKARLAPSEAAAMQARADEQHRGAQAVLRALGVTLRVEGPPPTVPGLVVPNHFSLLDVFVVSAAVRCAMTGRGDAAEWPVLGRVAEAMAFLGVDRTQVRDATAFARTVRQRLADGVNVCVFAEGTVSDGTALLPFKTGAFEAIAGTDTFVYPCYQQLVIGRSGPIRDLRPLAWHREPMPRSVWRTLGYFPGTAVVRFGDPIPALGETRKTLAAKSRDAVDALRLSVQHDWAGEEDRS